MRALLFVFVFTVGAIASGCGPSKATRQNDPPPAPEDSGADKSTAPKPVAPKKQ